MKRLLQRVQDGLYYQGQGAWTNNPDHAFVFNQTAVAIECCLRENLPPTHLVMKFEDSAFDIRVPCFDSSSNAALKSRSQQADTRARPR
jgi:hypothetical protein